MQTQLVVNGTRNEKDWFILLKKRRPFRYPESRRIISLIKCNQLIFKRCHEILFKKLQWATITSIFLMTQFDWLESYSCYKGSVKFSHEAWHSNFLINTYHIGRVILFSIKLNCHIGTSIYFIVHGQKVVEQYSIIFWVSDAQFVTFERDLIFEGTDCMLCEVGDHHPRFLQGEVHRCPNFFKALIIVIISWRSSHFVAVNWLVNDSRAHIREKSTL